MKTPLKLLASALLLSLTVSVSSPVQAGDDKTGDDKTQAKAFAAAMFPATAASKVWLCMDKYQKEKKVTLELLNEQGQVLFEEIVCGRNSKQKGYRQQFDMSQLADGNYTFRIAAGTQKEEFAFKLSTPTMQTIQPTRLIAIK
jgi:hypothetical protein